MIFTARKILLYPITILWALVLSIRHFLYDHNFLFSYKIPVKSICVGNLDFGGTGKTPYIEFLIRKKLEEGFKQIAIVSRGYGRKTNEILYVFEHDKAERVGDEPLQIKKKFKDKVVVIVASDRKKAIEILLKDYPEIELLLLDDAFQHRKVKASEDILLSTYSKPFWMNSLFPSGSLRDLKSRAKRANKIVITKCPENLDKEAQESIKKEIIKRGISKEIEFASLQYDSPIFLNKQIDKHLSAYNSGILITGIANPNLLKSYLINQLILSNHFIFSDHHLFVEKDIHEIISFKNVGKADIIITTEKDYIRNPEFFLHLQKNLGLDIAYIPIRFVMFE